MKRFDVIRKLINQLEEEMEALIRDREDSEGEKIRNSKKE